MTDSAVLATSPSRFDSLADLRREHAELLRAWLGGARDRTRVEQFVDRARVTGTILDASSDRDAAQGALDYWTATLVTTPTAPRGTASLTAETSSVFVGPPVLEPFDASRQPDLADRACPYIGLNAFVEDDASRFFGREEAIVALADRVANRPVMIVSGASGSGKSSLVLAGLVPRLKKPAPNVQRDGILAEPWRVLPIVIPGTDPLSALLRAVTPSNVDPQTWVSTQRERLDKNAGSFMALVAAAAPGTPNAPPSLLVVDQFEELFTLCRDERTRDRFCQAILAFANDTGGRRRVVLTIRDDLAGEAATFPVLKSLFGDQEAIYTPPPLSARELQRVIEQPARLVGLKFDEGIVDDLVKEVIGERTALPLLQFTLLRLWDGKERNRITWTGYRAVGSPRQALMRTAEATYTALEPQSKQDLAERLLVALIQPTVGGEYVRRRIRRETLIKFERASTQGSRDAGAVDEVLEAFVRVGLLRMTSGVEVDDDRFEVVHEALIRYWPRLRGWLDAEREREERKLQLISTARLWLQSGKQPGYLLTGDALGHAKAYAGTSRELDELVQASEQGARRTTQRLLVAALTAVTVLLALVIALWKANREIATQLKVATSAKNNENAAVAAAASQIGASVTPGSYGAAPVIVPAPPGQNPPPTRPRLDTTAKTVRLDTVTARRNDPRQQSVAASGAIQRIVADTKTDNVFWKPGTVMHVQFLDGSAELQATVQRYAAGWSKYASLDFDFSLTKAPPEVRISFKDAVSWSYLGTQALTVPSGSPTMMLGLLREVHSDSESRRIVLHEFGHVLGLIHENQNPLANIPWDTTKTIAYFAKLYGYSADMTRRNVLQPYATIGYKREFDPTSIMNFFEIPDSLTRNGLRIVPGYDLSASDKAIAARLYPGRGAKAY